MAEDNNNLIKRDGDRPPVEERRKDIQQFDGVSQVKKKEPNAVWAWITKMFFSGRTLKEICKEVTEDVLVPGIKDNARNGLVNIIDMLLYPDHKSVGDTNGGVVGSFINYASSYEKNKNKSSSATREDNKKKEEETIKSGFEYPAFESKKKADDFLASMHAYVQKYETMSVQDLAWMQKKSIDFTWDKWGWYRNEILAIKQPSHISNCPRTPWIIQLPKAHEFDD